MQLSISGFIAEDDGTGGSRVTQITDLSALGCKHKAKLGDGPLWMLTDLLLPFSMGPSPGHSDGHGESDTEKSGENRRCRERVSPCISGYLMMC